MQKPESIVFWIVAALLMGALISYASYDIKESKGLRSKCTSKCAPYSGAFRKDLEKCVCNLNEVVR